MRSTTPERLVQCKASKRPLGRTALRTALTPSLVRPSDVIADLPTAPLTEWQLQATEELVVATVRETLARDETAALCITRSRAVIAASAAVAGFAVVNATVRVSGSPLTAHRAAGLSDPRRATAPAP